METLLGFFIDLETKLTWFSERGLSFLWVDLVFLGKKCGDLSRKWGLKYDPTVCDKVNSLETSFREQEKNYFGEIHHAKVKLNLQDRLKRARDEVSIFLLFW